MFRRVLSPIFVLSLNWAFMFHFSSVVSSHADAYPLGALTFPPTAHEQALKATVDMVKYYKNGWAAVLAFQDHPPTKAVGYPEW